jgi:hypothetical protein
VQGWAGTLKITPLYLDADALSICAIGAGLIDPASVPDFPRGQLPAPDEVPVGLVPLRLQELGHGRGPAVPDAVAVEREGAGDREEPAAAGRDLRVALPQDGPQDEARAGVSVVKRVFLRH